MFIKNIQSFRYQIILVHVWITSGTVDYETFADKILQIAAIIIQTEFIHHMKNITFRRRRSCEILQSQLHIVVHICHEYFKMACGRYFYET